MACVAEESSVESSVAQAAQQEDEHPTVDSNASVESVVQITLGDCERGAPDVPVSHVSQPVTTAAHELASLPDQNEILEKLTHIRNCKRNVLDMLDKMKKDNSKSMDKEMVANLVESYDSFKEQEDQFLAILERTMALKQSTVDDIDDGEESLPELESSVSSNTRPMIEGSVEEVGEVKALQQQKDLLTKMVEQQKKMKEIQHKRNQLLNGEDSDHQQADEERRQALAQVASERESIAAKQLELSSLKYQLEQVKQMALSAMQQEGQPTAAPHSEALRAVAHALDDPNEDGLSSGTEGSTVQGRLESLQQKKERMDTILNQLAALSSHERERTNVHETQDVLVGESGPAEDEEEDQLPQTIDVVKRQMNELGSVQDRLLHLQSLGQNLHETAQLPTESAESSDDSALDSQLRAAYETKLDEQQRALHELQSERGRLLEVKDQLMRMQGEATSDSDNNDLMGGDLRQEIAQHQAQLRREAQLYRGGVESARPAVIERPMTGLLSSSQPVSSVVNRRSHTPLNSMTNVEATSPESIITNPRIASFRRNNLLDRHPSGASSHDSPPSMVPLQASASHCGRFRETTPSVVDSDSGLRRTSSFSQFGSTPPHLLQQYSELQQHMDSIHNIFQQIATGESSRAMTPNPVPVTPQPDMGQQMMQQQMMMSLMTCQQQMHMQQMEMQKLQGAVHHIASNQQLQASHNSREGNVENGECGPAQPWMMHPSQFDNRPLSSQSLYNLLAPNPYLNRGQQSARAWQSPAPAGSPWAKRNLAASWNHPEGRASSAYRNTPVSPVMSQSESNDSPHSKPPSIPKLNLGVHKQSNLNARSRPRTRSRERGNNNLPGRAVASARAATIERDPSSHESVERCASTGSQFDSLREVIYSEVATLISQNEERPQFLLEMFRDMQLLGSDYMRTRAVQAIRGLLSKLLEGDSQQEDIDETEDEHRQSMAARHRDFASFLTTTPGEVTDMSGDENSRSNGSTPAKSNTTVVHLGSAPSQRSKRFQNIDELRGEGALNNKGAIANVKTRIAHIENRSRSASIDRNANAQVNGMDVSDLEKQIEAIVDELIPVLRHNASAACTPALLQYVRKLVMTLTASKCASSDATTEYFHRQLSTILDDTLTKYNGRKLEDCGEELLTDVSEVVFNELAFSRLMTNINTGMTESHKQMNSGGRRPSVPPKKLSESSSVLDMRKSVLDPSNKPNRLNQSATTTTYKITLAQSEVDNNEDENMKSSTPRLPTIAPKPLVTALSEEVGAPVLKVQMTNPYPKAFVGNTVVEDVSPPNSHRVVNLNGEPHPEDH